MPDTEDRGHLLPDDEWEKVSRTAEELDKEWDKGAQDGDDDAQD